MVKKVIFHAENNCGKKEIPINNGNFVRRAYVYGGVLREEQGAHSCVNNSTFTGMFKGNARGFLRLQHLEFLSLS